ncbi:MAG TPA: CDP-alcohol phosphatidyltransferase family protein [Actinomycetota bacterium]|nr:CDP-alcohol phosphatidyltransferase family protein [Actinomycetota bacterium]
MRDVPPPRKNQSAIGPLFGEVFAWPYRFALAGLYRSGIRPWQLTFLSLVANGVIGWLLVRGDRFVPGLLLIVAGLFDIFDGGVARLRGEAGPAGAFLDSVIDRVSDIILFGALFWSEAGQDRGLTAALCLSSLIVSLLVSYVRAEAESEGLQLTEGMMQRLERYVALMIGLTAPGALLPILILLTGLGGLTALQRMIATWAQLGVADRRARRAARERVTKSGSGFDGRRRPGV